MKKLFDNKSLLFQSEKNFRIHIRDFVSKQGYSRNTIAQDTKVTNDEYGR